MEAREVVRSMLARLTNMDLTLVVVVGVVGGLVLLAMAATAGLVLHRMKQIKKEEQYLKVRMSRGTSTKTSAFSNPVDRK